ncbi:exoprotein [Altererythrobacter indicus]|uniref:Exoprotein n=1 Tax=Altericroceibacterium indicum TaxID=374177 RepID=A0A845A688_9SPHN|nr:YdbH domain-containing protein [Altericroceibacterium indicum]MXP24879.1 exoprotein [Altericroceibacterium indicum]
MPPHGQDRDNQAKDSLTKRHFWRWFAAVCLFLISAVLLVTWVNRETIVDGLITSQLKSMGLDASYEIEEIGPRRQVLRHVVIGDPAKPDLTLDRAVVLISPRFGIPGIDEIDLEGLRLFGSYRKGSLSFGALDPVLFSGDGGSFEFPDYRLKLDDARAKIETDYGNVGVKLSGAGNLRSGFAGELAAVAPQLDAKGCQLDRVSLYGKVGIDSQQPVFKGPLRLERAHCKALDLNLNALAMQLDLKVDKSLKGIEAEGSVSGKVLKFSDYHARNLGGALRFTFRNTDITAHYDVGVGQVITPQVLADKLSVDGELRTRQKFRQIALSGEIDGKGVRLGDDYKSLLQQAGQSSQKTMLGPIFARIDGELAKQTRNSSLTADFKVQRDDNVASLVVPRASLRSSDGATLLSLSRFQMGLSSSGTPRLFGNFATGGDGLPRIAGRMERLASGKAYLRLRMNRYEADGGSIALPQLLVTQSADGPIGFSGAILADGALPGGFTKALEVPLSGSWSSSQGLSLWRKCAELRFDRLELASLAFDHERLQLCPSRGEPILRYGKDGLKVAAGTPSIDLSGTLGETHIAIEGGPLGIAYPGTVSAQDVTVTLGPDEAANRFQLSDFIAHIDNKVSGQFAGADVKLAAVPLDIIQAGGDWKYTDGILHLEQGHFRLKDRASPHRFEPLVSHGAELTLNDNLITAHADLFEPTSQRLVTKLSIRHDLGNGSGQADIKVPGLVLDKDLEITKLTPLALGVVANVVGVVTGDGRIDWNDKGVTSSGRFSSSALDFAAPFGPVQGVSGTLVFTDLLALTTAPDQQITIASVNPGIEVYDGKVDLQLRDATYLDVKGGVWPFLGGTLQLDPVTVTFGKDEIRRYTFHIRGLDAARFIEQMDLGNLNATGTFDGQLPVVFEGETGRIENGLLVSRPPGGNVSYVGELTYEDLSTMANFAFNTLRSLDYSQMRIAVDGDLTGELVTRVRFDGVKQGKGAKSNFITRRIARLPIRFDVNIRGRFYKLLGSLRSLYDPTAVRDPRELGLLNSDGTIIRHQTSGEAEEKTDGAEMNGKKTIQPPESEEMP